MNDVDEVRRLIAPADPLCYEHHRTFGRAETSALLSRATHRRRVPRRAVLATGLAAALGLGAVLVLDPFRSSPAAAETPPLIPYTLPGGAPAGPELEKIAASAKNQPAEPVTGEFRYSRTEQWSLDSAVSEGKTTSALVSVIQETWFRPDGSGRLRLVPGFVRVDRVGSPESLAGVTARESTRDETTTSTPLTDVDHLDTSDVKAFAGQAIDGANLDLPEGALIVQGIEELFTRQPVPPAARAKIWRLLSDVPGVRYRGEVSDRAGRRGAAFTIDDDGTAHGLPSQYLLIVDPETGALLEYDEILTTTPGALNVDVPAVLDLTVYLQSAYTATTSGPPAGR